MLVDVFVVYAKAIVRVDATTSVSLCARTRVEELGMLTCIGSSHGLSSHHARRTLRVPC
jgi:hypothetical protein